MVFRRCCRRLVHDRLRTREQVVSRYLTLAELAKQRTEDLVFATRSRFAP
jgi:hypothetical protein